VIFQIITTKMNWRMVELYVKISSIDNARDSLNNLPEISNRTENTIPSTINLAHQIHESDPERPIYLTHIGSNATDE
jgi:predicted nucleotidyltransferase